MASVSGRDFSGVRSWPILSNLILNEELRDALEEEREETGISMAEQMRQILCSHYALRCETIDYFGGKQPGGGEFTLRVSPELFKALQKDKKRSGAPMRRLVLEIISEHYNGGPP